MNGLWTPDNGDGTYTNPVIFADYSDPEAIRVGDTYYLTASSFNYTPGLPILTSHDLVNWKLVNYAIDNIEEERYYIPRNSEGVWAPAMRYHDGMLYIYYGMPDEGIYVVRTKDPLGKWEKPVCVLPGKGLIDSCPFWDEDGKAYIIHGYAKSRIGFKSILGIFEMSPDGLKAITEDHFIFDGNDPAHPAVTIEGPKVYKRNGYYYIFAPAGGVKEGWQVALRSKNIYGPYEIKTVMHQGNTVINGPHQGAWIDTEDGDDYFLHFQDRGLYGRIMHVQPMTWVNDWPVIGVNPDEDNCGEPVIVAKKPATRIQDEITSLDASDDFIGGKYSLIWQWLGNHKDEYCSKTDKDNGLRLYALNPSGDQISTIWRSSNVLTQKLVCPYFETDIKFNYKGLVIGDRAGCVMMGGQYACIYVKKTGDKDYSIMYAQSEGGDLHKEEKVLFEGTLNSEAAEICIRFNFDKKTSEDESPVLHISYSEDLSDFKDIGMTFVPSDHTWVGAKVGIFALAESTSQGGYADFEYVRTKKLG